MNLTRDAQGAMSVWKGIAAVVLLTGLAAPAAGEYRWEQAAAMQEPRSGFGAALHDGRIYVFGGTEQHQMRPLASAERYDPRADRWESIAEMPRPLTNMTAVSIGGHIYLIGGRTTRNEVTDAIIQYDVRNDRYRTTGRLPAALFAGAGLSEEGKLLLMGGSPAAQRYLRGGYLLSLPEGRGAPAPEMQFARSHFGLVRHGPVLWAIGGVSYGGPVAAVEALINEQWQARIRMPAPRGELGIAALGDTILVAGGMTREEHVTDVVQGYIPRTNRWTDQLPRMNEARADFALMTLERRVYAIGGRANGRQGMGAPLSSVEVLEFHGVGAGLKLEPPSAATLTPVYPNPANGVVSFLLPAAGGSIVVWGLDGRPVLSLDAAGGLYNWSAASLPAGAYPYAVRSGGTARFGTLVIVK